jgi:hypothetical protein
MSLRRLWVLVHGLPQESRTAAALHGEAAEWTLTPRLLAAVHNAIVRSNSENPPATALIEPPEPPGRSG